MQQSSSVKPPSTGTGTKRKKPDARQQQPDARQQQAAADAESDVPVANGDYIELKVPQLGVTQETSFTHAGLKYTVLVPPDLKPGDIFKVKTKAAATAAASGRSSWQLIPLR